MVDALVAVRMENKNHNELVSFHLTDSNFYVQIKMKKHVNPFYKKEPKCRLKTNTYSMYSICDTVNTVNNFHGHLIFKQVPSDEFQKIAKIKPVF